jgi:hypothetical protein
VNSCQNPDDIETFLYLWLKMLDDEEFLFYDIRSIPSYKEGNNLLRREKNLGYEKLKQINLSLLLGQQSMLPAHNKILRENMGDVSSLIKTFEYLDFLEIKKPTYVLDSDLYNKNNLLFLLDKHFTFVMKIPSNKN